MSTTYTRSTTSHDLKTHKQPKSTTGTKVVYISSSIKSYKDEKFISSSIKSHRDEKFEYKSLKSTENILDTRIQKLKNNVIKKEIELKEIEKKDEDLTTKFNEFKESIKEKTSKIGDLNKELRESLTEVYDDIELRCKEIENKEQKSREICSKIIRVAENKAITIHGKRCYGVNKLENILKEHKMILDKKKIELDKREQSIRNQEPNNKLFNDYRVIAYEIKQQDSDMSPLMCTICYINKINTAVMCDSGHTFCETCAVRAVDLGKCHTCRQSCDGYKPIHIC